MAAPAVEGEPLGSGRAGVRARETDPGRGGCLRIPGSTWGQEPRVSERSRLGQGSLGWAAGATEAPRNFCFDLSLDTGSSGEGITLNTVALSGQGSS